MYTCTRREREREREILVGYIYIYIHTHTHTQRMMLCFFRVMNVRMVKFLYSRLTLEIAFENDFGLATDKNGSWFVLFLDSLGE